MDLDHDDQDLSLGSLFTEPPRPPTPEPTIATYVRNINGNISSSDGSASLKTTDLRNWKEIQIRLVGTHPLWGHYLWNAARSFSSYLDAYPQLYRHGSVLELGAGGGLPGIITALNGAARVVLTDYPDNELIKNIEFNVIQNIPPEIRERVAVQGYIWGRPVKQLIEALPTDPSPLLGYDLVILSDLIFNHSQHDALLTTCELVLAPSKTSIFAVSRSSTSPNPDQSNTPMIPCVLVFYTHHRPHLAHRDMEFFTKARARGWNCEEIVTETFPPMFPDDPGEEAVRSTVHGWRLTR